MRHESLEMKVLSYLKKQDYPCTTEDVSRGVDISWRTCKQHLTKLAAAGEVIYKRVGRQNEWWIADSYYRAMDRFPL